MLRATKIRARWADRRNGARRSTVALGPGGALDPLREESVHAVDRWLAGRNGPQAISRAVVTLTSGNPDDLTMRDARLLGSADILLVGSGIPQAILDRARADALRRPLPYEGELPPGLVVELRRAGSV